jgi:hypothetical protein
MAHATIPAGRIGVLNTTDGMGVCTPKRAKAWVRAGKASWVAHNCVALNRSDPRIASEQGAVLTEEKRCRRIAEHGYDDVGRLMQPEELRHIPFAGQVERVYW